MNQLKLEFPALYSSADKASATAQRAFWWTIRAEFFLLFCVASISAVRNFFISSQVILTLILVLLAGVFVIKVYRKLDQQWYRCRAVAESVKTSTWRFAMRSHPFQDAENIEQPKAEFRNLLRDILRSNRHLAESLQEADSDQFTSSMLEARKLSVKERLQFYITHRIDDQRRWYTKKSSENSRALRNWVVATIVVYGLAAIALNSEQLGVVWLSYTFDPLILVVTSAIGWVQMRRHGELTASYNLTAHEIGIIRSNSDSVTTEEELSDFVNEAELAFSREHTQWVARRDAS